MCGLAGEMRFDGGYADVSACERVTERLARRGPDGCGVWSRGPIALGHRRLSIIDLSPAGWVAQEVVALSSHPTVSGTHLQPRHVDLRAFVYLRGTAREDCTLADLALTRVAPDGSLVVNSSRGGGAKDTWIIGEPEAMPSPTEGTK